MQRASVAVDVASVRTNSERMNFCAKLGENSRSDAVRSTMRSIDDDVQSFERSMRREGVLAEDDIATARIFEACGATDGSPRDTQFVEDDSIQEPLDFGFFCVGKLEAVRAEDLDAVVAIRVVACADDDARICSHAAGQLRDGRRRDGTAEHHVTTHGANARRDGRFEHVSRQTRVFADDDAYFVGFSSARDKRDGSAEAQSHLRRHRRLVRDAANSVRSEELSRAALGCVHRLVSLLRRLCLGHAVTLVGEGRKRQPV